MIKNLFGHMALVPMFGWKRVGSSKLKLLLDDDTLTDLALEPDESQIDRLKC